jgi:hypothetical protein
MKIILCLTFFVLGFLLTIAQNQQSGKYVEVPSEKNFFYGSKLNLNCNNTFFRQDSAYQKDSAILSYGTWKIIKDSQLILHIDSIITWGSKDFPNVDLKLKIINNQIFKQFVSRKEYNDLTNGHNKKRGFNREKFDAFKQRELSRFYSHVINFLCQ